MRNRSFFSQCRDQRAIATWIALFAFIASSILPQPAYGGGWLAKLRGKWQSHKGIASAEALAAEIDSLEHHIDWYGSIVAKQPNVWGQARLMKHRREFEEQLSGQIGTFETTLQGSLTRSDQSFLTSAMALSAAISGSRAVYLPPSASTSEEIIERRRAELRAAGITDPTPAQLTTGTADNIDLAKGVTEATGFVPTIATTNVARSTTINFPNSQNPASPFKSNNEIALAPTDYLDQMARYINHLHEIRRINEGDDTVDSPGYALHLVRIPISILPGTRTRKGYGAEVTVTASPILGPELLPVTFRDLAINDLVEQVSEPLAEFFSSKSSREEFIKYRNLLIQGAAQIASDRVSFRTPPETASAAIPSLLAEDRPSASRYRDAKLKLASRQTVSVPPPPSDPTAGPTLPPDVSSLPPLPRNAESSEDSDYGAAFRSAVTKLLNNEESSTRNQSQDLPQTRSAASPNQTYENPVMPIPGRSDSQDPYENLKSRAFSQIKVSQISASRSRNARFAFPPTQITEVYGEELMTPVSLQAFDVLLNDRIINDPEQPVVVQHHLVTNYVQDQVTAAYNFMARPENLHLWQSFATPDLAQAIQSRDSEAIKSTRKAFLDSLPNLGKDRDRRYGDQYTTTASLAWAILVESVLLNERLIQDIREAAASKGAPAPPALGEGLPFFLPNPPAEAREVFNEYVRLRFPIHVFALDPINSEQNIADQALRTRELQLALSLAFVTGSLSAANLTRFGRRLELQAQTIALNRTQIAFSHGEDTFGWRFQPRFQTPPTEGNFTVAFRDNLLGGPTREQDRRQTELEPGMRECVALVVMPSFVPYAKFETRTNWYRLNSPKHAEIDASKFLQLSQSIQRAYTLAHHVCDTGLYRDGDIGRLVNRVKQLSAELPFQSLTAQVPHENTLGGFEMFNVGITDLAPELRSWYGAPGIDLTRASNLFLIGDNFSVHQTSVIVGNQLINGTNVDLLSRQVMRVTIPSGSSTVVRNGQKVVEVSIATPYGTSQSLRIPATSNGQIQVSRSQPPPPTSAWDPNLLVLAHKFDVTGNFLPDADTPTRRPIDGLSIAQTSGDFPSAKADVFLSFAAPYDKLPSIVLRDVPFDPASGALKIVGAQYNFMITEIFTRFSRVFNSDKPPVDVTVNSTVMVLTTTPVTLRPVSNALTIRWKEKK